MGTVDTELLNLSATMLMLIKSRTSSTSKEEEIRQWLAHRVMCFTSSTWRLNIIDHTY